VALAFALFSMAMWPSRAGRGRISGAQGGWWPSATSLGNLRAGRLYPKENGARPTPPRRIWTCSRSTGTTSPLLLRPLPSRPRPVADGHSLRDDLADRRAASRPGRALFANSISPGPVRRREGKSASETRFPSLTLGNEQYQPKLHPQAEVMISAERRAPPQLFCQAVRRGASRGKVEQQNAQAARRPQHHGRGG